MFTRRELLTTGAAAAYALPTLLQPAAASAATNTTVVAILLAGGNDGLNTVIPMLQYGKYFSLRQAPGAQPPPGMALAYTQAALAGTMFDANFNTASSSATQYAFNPAMTSLRAMYAGGHLAVITGVGIPPDDPSRLSHEVGQFDWAAGSIKSLGQNNYGWLGKSLDAAKNGDLPPMVSLTGQTATVLTGLVQQPLVLGTPIDTFAVNYANLADTANRQAQYAAIQSQPLTGKGESLRGLSAEASSFVGKIQTIAKNNTLPDYPLQKSFIGLQLQQIARLLLSGATGTRAFYAIHGGFDTHADQQTTQPTLLGQLSDAMSAFYTYLRGRGASSNVIVMTYSDFGRRANVNATFGTDHGTANVAFVMGDPVKGGVYGQYPDLGALDSAGNLQVQVDFRNQISDVVSYLGSDPNPIVGKTYGKLGFV